MAERRASIDFSGGDVSVGRLAVIVLPMLALVGAALWYGMSLVQPPPQKVVVFSTGGEAGAYHGIGRRYQAHLARAGVTVQLRPSAGSIENMARLTDPKSDVSVALMQGGVASEKTAPGVLSVGRMFYEPLWVFYRHPDTLDRLSQLKGLRIAIGAEGSGTRHLALTVLRASRIGDANATLEPLTGPPAIEALLAGRLDAVMLSMAPESAMVQELLRNAAVKVMSFAQADAMTRMHPFLARVTLPRGVVDLDLNIPPDDIQLIAPVAALLVRDDLHPALVALLAQAAADIHASGSLLQQPGAFPAAVDPEFTMSPDAQRFYRSGPPFLQRYLPFWLANFVERALILLVPLATVSIPLIRGLPALYRWRMRRRLQYWYGRLSRLEARILKSSNPTVVAEQRDEILRIDEAVRRLRVPNAFAEPYYNLRSHIDFVSAKLAARA